jgi:G8 domain/Domain of unknown function (DUF4214)
MKLSRTTLPLALALAITALAAWLVLLPKGMDPVEASIAHQTGPIEAPAASTETAKNSGAADRGHGRIVDWRGGTRDHRWSNPTNWESGQIPTSADVARFSSLSASDAVVDKDSVHSVEGLVLEQGFGHTLALQADLLINGELAIAGGALDQGDHNLSAWQYKQTGGHFAGGQARLTIDGEAIVSDGVLDTPGKLMSVKSLHVDSPGVVRLASNAKLELSGSGEPLTGRGSLDMTTNKPNSVEYTGQASTDLTAAGPARAFHTVGNMGQAEMRSKIQSLQGKDVEAPQAITGFSRIDSLTMTRGENSLFCAAIDTAAGFAYFGTFSGTPGIVVKVRLSDFTRVGALVLNSGESALDAAVIDPAGGFAYFGTLTFPGKIVKVRLSDFTRVDGLTFNSGEDAVNSAVIDPGGGFAYFGTQTSPGIVVKVQLSTLTRIGALTLNAGENDLRSAVIDTGGGFAYFGTNNSPVKVVKVQLSTFTRIGAITFNSGESGLQSAVIDPAGGFAYFGTNTSPGRVVKVQLSTFTRVSAITFNSGENQLLCAVIDTAGGFAYFGTFVSASAPNGIIVKVQLSTFTRVAALSLNPSENKLRSAVIDPAGGFAYFGTQNSPGAVVKVRLSDFTRDSALAFLTGEDELECAVIDPGAGFAYFGAFGTAPGIVIKVRLSDFTKVGILTFASGENQPSSAVIDTAAGFAYFGTSDQNPDKVVKVRLSDFTRIGALTLNPGEDDLTTAVIDPSGGFVYFGTSDTAPGIIVKVRLSDFTRIDALSLNAGEGVIESAVIDPAGGFAYLGTDDSPGLVVKVRLSDLMRVGDLTLNAGENDLGSAVIDTSGGFAYFGTFTNPGIVVKVQLSSLTRVGALPFNSGENTLTAAVIDTAGGFAYFGTDTFPGRVVKVRLSDFTRIGAVTFNSGENIPSSAVIDPNGGFAYFGTGTFPGIVVKVDIASANTSTGNGLWSNSATWSSGQVPIDGEQVVIAAGHTVTLDTNTNNLAKLTIGGTLTIGNDATARTLMDAGDLTINGGGVLQPGAMVASHQILVGGHWTNNGMFDAGATSITVSFTGGNNTQMITGGSTTFKGLTINHTGTGGVTLGANVTVNGTLTLNSDLDTSSFTLTQPSGGTSAGAGDVVGNVNRSGFTTGGAALSFGNPFNSISFQSGTPPSDITINLVKAKPSDFSTAVNRTYTITTNGGSGFMATLRLHYQDSDLGSNSEGASLSLWRFNGTTWQKQTSAAFDTTDNWVQTNNVAQFSRWTLNSSVPTAAPANISGQITNPDGTPLGGVLVTLIGNEGVRRTITNAAGAYSFTNVTTDAFYTVSPFRANYVFAPIERSFALLGNKADAVFTASRTMEIANPLDTPEFFVRQHYLDFLEREPDPGGFDYWSTQIRQCVMNQLCVGSRRIGVSGAFFVELEFQQTGSYVYRMYKASLGRAPSYAEFSPDRAKVVGGANLEQNRAAFAAEWVSRATFKQQYPESLDAATFVNRLFDTAGLQPFANERQQQIEALINGVKTRAAVLVDLIEMAEFKTREYNASFVLMQYFGYLRRDPDVDGYRFWLDQMDRSPLGADTQRAMICSFITSAEYQNRFSSVVTRTNAECPH